MLRKKTTAKKSEKKYVRMKKIKDPNVKYIDCEDKSKGSTTRYKRTSIGYRKS